MEHALQIAGKVETGLSNDECLAGVSERDSHEATAAFCPAERLCGSRIHPNQTKQLKFLSDKPCILFTANVTNCTNLGIELDESGWL